MKKRILAAVAGMMLMSSTALAAVITTGTGTTESAALHDAMRSAVEEEVGLALASRSSMIDFQVRDKVYTRAEGYIQSYEILEKSFDGKWYRVKIKAEVNKELRADLQNRDMRQALIGANLQDPRIGVLVLDKYGQENTAAENVFIGALQAAGFSRLTDLKQLEQVNKYRLANAVFHDQYELMETLRGIESVDYMVVARLQDESTAYNTLPGFGDFRSGQVTMGVRMFNVNNGEIVFADSLRGMAMHTDATSAMSNAVSKLAKKVACQVAKAAVQKAANPEQHIQLIAITSRPETCLNLQDKLRNLPGVSGVFTRNLSYGNMCFDINFCGTSEDFMNILAEQGIIVLEMTSEYIKISC